MENNTTAPAHATTGWWYEEFDDDITGNEPFIVREARATAGTDGRVRAIATVILTDSREDAEANAEFIVRACNSHADLLKLADEYRDACTTRISLLKDELKDEHEFSGDAADIRAQIEHWKAVRGDCNTIIAQANEQAS